MHTHKKTLLLLPVSALLFSGFIYGFFGLLTRIVGFSIPLFYASFTRGVVGFAVLGLYVTMTSGWKRLDVRSLWLVILRAVVGYVGFLGSFIAFYYLPFGITYFVFYASVTIGGYLIGMLLFREHIDRVRGISLASALVGLIVMFGPERLEAQSLLYLAAAAVSGLGTAGWNSLSKFIPHRYTLSQLNAYDQIIAGLLALTASLVVGEKWIVPSFSAVWGANMLFVFMFLATGQLMIYGFRRLDVQIASIIMLSEILFGVILGYAIYSETISMHQAVGGALVLVAILTPLVVKQKRSTATA